MIAKVLTTLVVLVVSSLAVTWLINRFPGLRLGRLPGDFALRRGDATYSIPLASLLLLSVAMTLAFQILRVVKR